MKTEKQIIENLRDEVYTRIVTSNLNRLYWSEVLKQSKVNTSESVEAQNSIGINKTNIKKDKLFLKVIDKKLKGLK